MKKLTLKALNLGAAEVLTRNQLKQVTGGNDDGSSGGKACETDADCGKKKIMNGCGQEVEVDGVCTSKKKCVWTAIC